MVATAAGTEYRLFIGGSWDEAQSGTTFEVINPATLEVIATVPNGGRSDMQRAIDLAAAVQPSWGKSLAKERARILADAARRMHDEKDRLARIMTEEEGKPLAESVGEINYAASFLEWFAGEAERVYGMTIPAGSPSKRIMAIKRPVGVTAAITPWNFPAAMITRKLGAALAAGCTMVIKPATMTPLTALEMARIFQDVGLPDGVLSVVAGTSSRDLAAAIMEDSRVRKLSFTGSTEVGKILMKQAADTMKRLSLELGGHAPFIVFEDADLDAAVENAIYAKMRNMGETCIAANRIFVQRSVRDEFARRLVARMGQLKVGNGLEPGVVVGPLVDKPTFDKVVEHVDDARNKGGNVVLGGKPADVGKGFFYEPTVITDVKEDMLLTVEETFGPVAGILSFDTEDEVVRRANDTQYGLAGYFFTRDIGRVWRLAENLEYGILGANDGAPSAAQAPFGGVKESGFGREGSTFGIEEYLEIKYISLGGIA